MYFCSMNYSFFIVAGDPSGDAHAALLMKELKIIFPDALFTGIGGPYMLAEGLNSLVHFDSMNIVGFWEVIKHYPFLKKALNLCEKEISKGRYDAFIGIDYPGFNMRLGASAKQKGIPSICYIAPQLWAWGSNRAQQVKKSTDLIMTVFPFEHSYFSNFDIETAFVGHPILDNPLFIHEFSENRDKTICLMPGSRSQELYKHLPLMRPIIEECKKRDLKPLLCVPERLIDHPGLKQFSQDEIVTNARQCMRTAKAGIVKIGTSTLEAALLGMPFISYYKTSYISYLIAKSKIHLTSISLPNILLEKNLIPELIQSDAQAESLHTSLFSLLDDPIAIQNQVQGFHKIRTLLGGPGASKRAALTIEHYLKNRI